MGDDVDGDVHEDIFIACEKLKESGCNCGEVNELQWHDDPEGENRWVARSSSWNEAKMG